MTADGRFSWKDMTDMLDDGGFALVDRDSAFAAISATVNAPVTDRGEPVDVGDDILSVEGYLLGQYADATATAFLPEALAAGDAAQALVDQEEGGALASSVGLGADAYVAARAAADGGDPSALAWMHAAFIERM